MKRVLFSFCLLLSFFLKGNSDSLISLLPVTKGVEKINLLNKLSRIYSAIENEKAYSFALEACKLSQLTANHQLEASSYISMADIFYKRGDLKQALLYSNKTFGLLNGKSDEAEKAMNYNLSGLIYMNTGNYGIATENFIEANKLYGHINNKQGVIKSIHNLALLEYIKGNYNKALEGYLNALELAEREKNPDQIAHIQVNIGIVFAAQDNYKKAILYYEKALQTEQQIGNKRGAADVLASIGTCYFNQNDFSKSLEFHQKAFELFKETSDSIGISQQYNNIGDLYEHNRKSEEALDYYLKALEIRKKSDDNSGLILSYQSIANFYMAHKQFDKSILYYQQAFATAHKSHYIKLEEEIAIELAEAYYQKGDYKNAYLLNKQYAAVKDSLLTAEKIRIAEELQTRYETTKKEKELIIKNDQIIQLEKDGKISVLTIICLSSGVLLLFVIGIRLYRIQQNKITKERFEAKQEKELLETKQKLTEAELSNSFLKHEQTEKELKYKSNELTELALHISHKNDFLKELKEKLTVVKKEDSHTDEVLKKIKDIEKNISQNISLIKQKEEFQNSIANASKGFFDKLNQLYPDLTESDKRLAAMLRINLSSKEIAAILNIEPKSVDMNRYRLRKKLNLEGEQDISKFLVELV